MKSIVVRTYELGKYEGCWEFITNNVMKFLDKAIDYVSEFDEAPMDYRLFETLELLTVHEDKTLRVYGLHLYSEGDDGIQLGEEKLSIERVYRSYDAITMKILAKNGIVRTDVLGTHNSIVIYYGERFTSFHSDSTCKKLYG